MRFISVFLRLAPLLVALICSGCPEAKDNKPKEPAATKTFDAGTQKPEGKHAGMAISEISYDESKDGLLRLMRDLKTAILANDEPEIAILLASLRLDDDRAFFDGTFGSELGEKLSKEYRPLRVEIGVLAKHLKSKFEAGQRIIETFSFAGEDMQTATGYQNAALEKMKVKRTLYSVRLLNSDKNQSFHLWSFVHFENSFRFIGKLNAVTDKKTKDGRDLNELRKEDAERLIAKEK